jgi:translation initiation factor 1
MSDNLVYSTETGRIRPSHDKSKPHFTGDGIVRIRKETKGRKGKGMSVITGIDHTQHDLKKICKQLKQTCGCGGAVKDNTIEIQGDARDKIKALLEKMGMKVKLAGG